MRTAAASVNIKVSPKRELPAATKIKIPKPRGIPKMIKNRPALHRVTYNKGNKSVLAGLIQWLVHQPAD